MIPFFVISIIVILLLSNIIILKRYSLKFKWIYSIFILLFYIVIFVVIIFYSWNNSGNLVPEPIVKKIKINNLQQKKCIAYINFEYSDKEIFNNLNIDIANNQIDTINLDIGETKFVKTPIFLSDTIKFPENFGIKITDLKGKIIKKYDKKVFFDEIEKSKYETNQDIEKKETQWNLKLK